MGATPGAKQPARAPRAGRPALCARRLAVGLAALCAALGARPAAADAEVTRLPRHAVELGVGPYRPTISGDAEVAHVRNLVYDQGHNWLGRHPVQFTALYGRYLVDRLGLLGPYVRAGYWQQSAAARTCSDPSDPNTSVPCTLDNIDSSSPSLDATSLHVLPVGVGALWRIDGLRRGRDWPLAFALKAGVDYHIFWSSLGAGLEVLPSSEKKAIGGVWGLSGAAQVALALEGLRRRHPPYGSRRAANPAYLFAEYRLVWAPGLFQRGPRVDLSDLATFALGLALELP